MATAAAESPDNITGQASAGNQTHHEHGSGPLKVEEYQRAMAARPRQPTPQTMEEQLSVAIRKGIFDPSHKPSHPDPLTRVASGPSVPARFTPTPSLDPRTIERIEGVDDSNVGYVRSAIDAFGEIHSGLQRQSDARLQLAKDTSKTEANQTLVLAAEAEKLQDRATRRFDAAHKTLTDGLAAIDKMLSDPLTHKADNSISAEIRSYFKALGPKRDAAVNEAIQRKDITTLTAVLGGPCYLSGLTPEAQTHYTRTYRELTSPDVAKRLNVMRKALDLLDARAGLIFTQVEAAMGASWETIQKLRTSRSAAEQAILLINDPNRQ